MSEILDRLRRSVTTASNDDYSEVGSDKRERHIERLTAMQDAHAEIERLTAALIKCRDLAGRNGPSDDLTACRMIEAVAKEALTS